MESSDNLAQLKERIKELEKENEQLIQSSFLHKKIVDKLPLGIQIFDKEGFSYEMNPAQKELLGLPTMEEGIGKFNVLTDAYSKAMGANEKYEKVYKGETYDHEFEYDLGAKENKWNTRDDKRIFHETIFPIKDEKGKVKYAVSVLQDKTEERNAEKALKERKDLLQRVFESSFDLIALTDLEGNFTLVGKSHEILGYDSDSLIGKNVLDFVHPDDAAYVNEEFAHFLKTGEDRMVEYRNKCNDGTYLWFETIGTLLKDEKGKPEQILFNTRNITERKNAEETLKKEKAWSEKIVSNAPNIIIGLGEKSTIKVFNSYAERLTGYKAEEVIGKKWINIFIPKELKETIYQVWGEILKNKRIDHHFENEIITKSGEQRLIAWSNTILTEDDEFQMVLSIGTDITEKKQAEEALRSNYALLKIAGETASFGGWSVDLEKNIATWSDAAVPSRKPALAPMPVSWVSISPARSSTPPETTAMTARPRPTIAAVSTTQSTVTAPDSDFAKFLIIAVIVQSPVRTLQYHLGCVGPYMCRSLADR